MTTFLRSSTLAALLVAFTLPAFSQGVGDIDTECRTLFGSSDWYGIAKWEWEGNDEGEPDPGMFVLGEGSGVTITTPSQQNSGSWTSTEPVSGFIIKGGPASARTIVDPPALAGDYDNILPNASSHITFCGRETDECEMTTVDETVGKDGGAGYVDAKFTNTDGLLKVTFTVLSNFNVVAPAGFTETSADVWEWTDGGAAPMMATFRLVQANTSISSASYYAVVTSDCGDGFETDLDPPHTFDSVPDAFALDSAYPNPFNPETTIRFTLADEAAATLSVYDVTGRLVKTLVTSTLEAGTHSVRWNGTDEAGQAVASGLYLYRLEAGAFSQTRSMLLLK